MSLLFKGQFGKHFKVFIYFLNSVPGQMLPHKMGRREYIFFKTGYLYYCSYVLEGGEKEVRLEREERGEREERRAREGKEC